MDINTYIENLELLDNELLVLKGIDLSRYADLDMMVGNKFNWFSEIMKQSRKIISFEEYICLYDFIISQFSKIYILENNIYMNIFPAYLKLSPKNEIGLLYHFNEEVSDPNVDIGDLKEYTNIYSNYLRINDFNYCVYNVLPHQLNDEKVNFISLYDKNVQNQLIVKTRDDSEIKDNYIDICDEFDYLGLIGKLASGNIMYAGYSNCTIDKAVIGDQLNILNSKFTNQLHVIKIKKLGSEKLHSKEIKEILKTYWGYDNFRDLSVYDLDELEAHKKVVKEVSQEDIINDLICQAENCIVKDSESPTKLASDIFVTAPTGAGKSLMFQIPAIYLAEKHELLTLVITPLIGLMNDQVSNLNMRGYKYARTINSDISPIIKEEILNDVAEYRCHILYLSPESLLSRSDIEQLIGERKIGMLIIDEAHIVTTWGKQFRPDYWYLGDHVRKLRKKQQKSPARQSFIIATFTATAIYEGIEDMYHETLNSLHMINTITYLGYIRRSDITIDVSEVQAQHNKLEYERNKFDSLVEIIDLSIMRNKKTLIYFPTVALINRFYEYCYTKDLSNYVTKYHGQLDALVKQENYEAYLNGDKIVMLATKAFGMGIDIKDIEVVAHFAPTGNVCDYLQEIGRAARAEDLSGIAVYKHMSTDFKHINKLHGLSTIKKYQLVEVIKKVYELYTKSRYSTGNQTYSKKINEMLVDTESFEYIFDGPMSDQSNLMNKVKTAMLLIQKDYENRSFSPFYIKPIPLFAFGFFAISPSTQQVLNDKYGDIIKVVEKHENICEVNLKRIWENSFDRDMSFPKFKYLLYTKSSDLGFNEKYTLNQAMSIDVFLENNHNVQFSKVYNSISKLILQTVRNMTFITEKELTRQLSSDVSISEYRAQNIISVFLSAMEIYARNFNSNLNSRIYKANGLKDGGTNYQFNTPVSYFFKWLNKGYEYIKENIKDEKLYIVTLNNSNRGKEYTTILGILESMGVLTFKCLGGSNSQIYIYVNETKTLKMVTDKPYSYNNKLLNMVALRHTESVKMLQFLFQNNFTSEQIWDYLEDYFLGKIPDNLDEFASQKLKNNK